MQQFFSYLQEAASLWYKKDADHLAAGVSYYAVFAIVPLLLITITSTSFLFGRDYVLDVLARWGEVMGTDILGLLVTAVNNLENVSGEYTIPVFGLIFFSGIVVVMFNTFTSGLLRLWDEESRGVIGWIEKTIRSILFVFVLQGFVLVLIGTDALLKTVQNSGPSLLLEILEFYIVIGVTTVLFAVAYGLLAWNRMSLRARLAGGFVASILFSIAKILVSFYVVSTPIPTLFGAAGLVVVLLIWIFVTTCILYYGAAVAYVEEESRLAQHTGHSAGKQSSE